MFHAPQYPHISAAVKHTRGWITILSILVAVCCLSQMLTYGFVRFTEVRFTEVSTPTPYGERSLQVIPPPVENESKPVAANPAAVETHSGSEIAAVGGVRAHAIEHGREVGPTRVYSSADQAMARINLFATSAGSLACVMLALMTLLGTVIAGGGNVPGVEKAVTATTWALVLGLLCLPWSSAFPHLRIPGVFATYVKLCAVADKVPGSVSPTAAFFQWIIMPLGAATLSMIVLGMYRSGVEHGVIATSVNHFDAAIQKEMTELAKRGVMPAGSVRSVGAMNRAVGMPAPSPAAAPVAPMAQMAAIPPAAAPIPAAPVARPEYRPAGVEDALDQAAAMASSLVRETQTSGRSVVDGNYRRLI
jgi:hypothetical protein